IYDQSCQVDPRHPTQPWPPVIWRDNIAHPVVPIDVEEGSQEEEVEPEHADDANWIHQVERSRADPADSVGRNQDTADVDRNEEPMIELGRAEEKDDEDNPTDHTGEKEVGGAGA